MNNPDISATVGLTAEQVLLARQQFGSKYLWEMPVLLKNGNSSVSIQNLKDTAIRCRIY